MSATSSESTDRLTGDTSAYTPRVLTTGSSTITTSSPGGGAVYYLGTATIDLSAYDYTTFVPEADVYVQDFVGGGSIAYFKAPYSNVSTVSGEVSQHVSFSLQRGTAKSTLLSGTAYTLRLVINFYSRVNADVLTCHWQIKSTKAAPFS